MCSNVADICYIFGFFQNFGLSKNVDSVILPFCITKTATNFCGFRDKLRCFSTVFIHKTVMRKRAERTNENIKGIK